MSKIDNFHFLSTKDVELVVQSALGTDTKLIDFCFKTYSEQKQGFLGSHWGLMVSAELSNGDRIKKKFFIKTVPYDPEQDQRPGLTERDRELFFKETNFYKHIVPELARHVEAEDLTWCARCFKVTDELLVFEDLKDRNFKTRSTIMDTETIKSALSSLAKLHCSSVIAERRLGKTFPELHPQILDESLFQKKTVSYTWFLRGVDITVAVAKKYGYQVTSKIPDGCKRIFDAISKSRKWRNVICHGDAWSNNLLFDDAKPTSTCIMVDYQMTRYAPAMTDIAQFMYLATRKDYRDQHEKTLLKHYHEVFCKVLRKNDPEAELPNLEDLMQEYEEMRIVGMITVFMYFPIPLACEKMSEEFLKECNGINALLYEDRVDIVLKMLEEHSDFDERISEIVAEFMEKIGQSSNLSN